MIDNYRNKNIDGLKAFAVLYIILHHFTLYRYYKPLYFIVGQGQLVVIFLFILSGYMIGLSYADKQFNGWYFLKKRFLRIYPPFIASLILSYLLASYDSGYWISFPVDDFLGNLINIQDLSNRYKGIWIDVFMDNTPLWYVSYLWWFYMLYILIRYIPIDKQHIIVSLISISGAIGFYIWPNTIFHILSYFVIWWIGVRLAYYKHGEKSISIIEQLSLYLPLLIVLGIYSLGAISVSDWSIIWSYPIIEMRHFIYALLIASLISYKQKHNFNLNIFNVFSPLSKISFGLFVLHYPILISHNPFHTGQLLLDYSLAFVLLVFLAYLLDYKLGKFIYNRP